MPDINQLRAAIYQQQRVELTSYLTRLVTRGDVAEELAQQAAESEAFIAQSKEMVGSPETKTIAHEHLMVCFACTLRNLKPSESASLLLKSVYGFTVKETASVMNTNDIQVKNRIQSARSKISHRFADSCALMTPKGISMPALRF